MEFLKSAWQGAFYDNGLFSTKRAAYVVSVVVTSWLVLHINTMTWDILTAYAVHCTGPGALREFLAHKADQSKEVKSP